MNKLMQKAEEMVKEFHQYWLENGEPHPSSNAYLAMNREFWFRKGIDFGRDTSDVTRFEVINDEGRAMVEYGIKVTLSFQDDDRTLKVFLEKKK